MKSFAQALDLKDDPQLIASYVEWHQKVYPEVLRALQTIGITKMKIFLLGTHLFMYYEARLFFFYSSSSFSSALHQPLRVLSGTRRL